MDLGDASADLFEPLQGESFAVKDWDSSFELVEVAPLGSSATAAGRSPFALTFKGRCADTPAQGLYRLDHPATGELEIFLVPVGMQDDEHLFEAVFN